LYALIANTVGFLVNDTHQELYIDVGLPINKKFEFKLDSTLTAIEVIGEDGVYGNN
jgi:hypothetical protein